MALGRKQRGETKKKGKGMLPCPFLVPSLFPRSSSRFMHFGDPTPPNCYN